LRPYLKNKESKKGWEFGSGGRVPTYQVWSPVFKFHYLQKKMLSESLIYNWENWSKRKLASYEMKTRISFSPHRYNLYTLHITHHILYVLYNILYTIYMTKEKTIHSWYPGKVSTDLMRIDNQTTFAGNHRD
jgi:hypothetical protein